MPLLRNLMTERFTNTEFEQLPQRAKDYIQHLEMVALALKDARREMLDGKPTFATAILVSDETSNVVDNFELRDDMERETLGNF